MKKNPLVSASIMCADLLALGGEISFLEKANADWLHLDVMDGSFVPNIVIGCPDLIKAIKPKTKMPLDVHLMIEKPERHIETFIKAGADILVFHYEATENPEEILAQIREAGAKTGVALKPKTPVSVVETLLDRIDMILIMTVEPGFAGQGFIEAMLDKITEVREMIGSRQIDVQVDGGLTLERIRQCYQYGANVFVGGTSSIFKKPCGTREDIKNIIREIHKISVNR